MSYFIPNSFKSTTLYSSENKTFYIQLILASLNLLLTLNLNIFNNSIVLVNIILTTLITLNAITFCYLIINDESHLWYIIASILVETIRQLFNFPISQKELFIIIILIMTFKLVRNILKEIYKEDLNAIKKSKMKIYGFK